MCYCDSSFISSVLRTSSSIYIFKMCVNVTHSFREAVRKVPVPMLKMWWILVIQHITALNTTSCWCFICVGAECCIFAVVEFQTVVIEQKGNKLSHSAALLMAWLTSYRLNTPRKNVASSPCDRKCLKNMKCRFSLKVANREAHIHIRNHRWKIYITWKQNDTHFLLCF